MKKKLMTVLALVLVIAMSVAGTYAYLTSQAQVKNTFTVGKVAITLDEAKVNEYGVVDNNAPRCNANEYKLMPGHEYTKDPTVHFQAKSEASYLFVKVENGISAIEAAGNNTIAKQIEDNGWTALDGVTNVYYKQVDANTTENAIDYPIFGSFKIADNASTTGYDNANITVTAYAIQADGMTNAADAWTKLDA